MHRFYISCPTEFNYPVNLQFLLRSPRELLHRVEGDSVYKLIRIGNEKILFRIRPGQEKIIVQILAGETSEEARAAIRQYVTEWFDLNTDLRPFYRIGKNDPMLRGLIEKFHGYRIIGQPDLFESIVWAILGQQINLSFAYTLKQRFVETFGERVLYNKESYFLFPTPALVAGLPDARLLSLQFSRQKSRYTIAVGEAFASGQLSKEMLTGLPLQEAKEKLMRIKGIGNWTANYALMKTFRYPDAFPLEDAGLHNAIRNLRNMKKKPTLVEVKKIFKKYKGWEAYATLYLWKSL